MKDPYSILGVTPDATDEQIRDAYHSLARKYHPDNFNDDNPLKDLAEEKMQEINAAYDEINRLRESQRSNTGGEKSRDNNTGYNANNGYNGNSGSGDYFNIRIMIQNRRFRDAEVALASIPAADRTAEWHYLTSVLLMHNNRINDAMRELEIACTMDPGNEEYQKAKEMFNNTARSYGNTAYGSTAYGNTYHTTRRNDACDCCANLICLDCLCECCGADLIGCI